MDENEFISRRVTIRQGHNPHILWGLPFQRLYDFVVLFLDADGAFRRAHKLHGYPQAAQKEFGVVMEQFLVLVEQGFAFGCVGDDE